MRVSNIDSNYFTILDYRMNLIHVPSLVTHLRLKLFSDTLVVVKVSIKFTCFRVSSNGYNMYPFAIVLEFTRVPMLQRHSHIVNGIGVDRCSSLLRRVLV